MKNEFGEDMEVISESVGSSNKKSSRSRKSKSRTSKKVKSDDKVDPIIDLVLTSVVDEFDEYKSESAGIISYKVPRVEVKDIDVPMIQSAFDRLGIDYTVKILPDKLSLVMNKKDWNEMRRIYKDLGNGE